MTTATQLTLTDFLLTRIAEVAAHHRPLAERAQPPYDAWHHQMLAECEAKRQIVASVQRALPRGTNGLGPSVLMHLATVYANHPDYRQEWRP